MKSLVSIHFDNGDGVTANNMFLEPRCMTDVYEVRELLGDGATEQFMIDIVTGDKEMISMVSGISPGTSVIVTLFSDDPINEELTVVTCYPNVIIHSVQDISYENPCDHESHPAHVRITGRPTLAGRATPIPGLLGRWATAAPRDSWRTSVLVDGSEEPLDW